MQTFVVKLASGISALVASLVLTVCQISSDETVEATVSGSSRIGLRMSMTIIPIFVLIIAVIIFRRHYILTDEKLNEIKKELEKN